MKNLVNFISRNKFLRFTLFGTSGVLINMILVTIFTEIILGREKYFIGYLIGLTFNLIYNFFMYSKYAFRVKKNHVHKYFIFISYSFLMAYVQASIVRYTIELLGVDYYLTIIIVIITILGIFNYIILKNFIFKKNN
jgi:putative flippase GtrA